MIRYQSTFTNQYGEEWIFEYYPESGASLVKGSDVDWQAYEVIEGVAYNLIMADDEKQWLLAAWEQAAERKSQFHDMLNQ